MAPSVSVGSPVVFLLPRTSMIGLEPATPSVIFEFVASAVNRTVLVELWIWKAAVVAPPGLTSTPVLEAPLGLRLMLPEPAWRVVVLPLVVEPIVTVLVPVLAGVPSAMWTTLLP